MGITQGHGGFVQVSSEQGKGAAFSIHVPADEGAAIPVFSPPPGPALEGQGESVLFVDDEPGVRKVVARVLERLNFNPMLAASAADALRFVEAHRSELKVIITDMNMPQMDGLAFVRAVRALLPTTPVIVASGHLEDRVAAELRTHGVTRTLSKPFPPDVLAAALRAALATQTE